MEIKVIIPALSWMTVSKKTRMATESFYVGGHLDAQLQKNYERQKKHKAWRKHCRSYLEPALYAEGLYNGIPVKEKGYRVSVEPFFYNGVHVDGTNVLKGMEDILVWKKTFKVVEMVKGMRKIVKKRMSDFFFKDDKMLGGNYEPPQYDKDNPRVEVTITTP